MFQGFFGGFVGSPRDFFGVLIFAPIRSSQSLETWSSPAEKIIAVYIELELACTLEVCVVRICTFKSLYLWSFLLKRYCVRIIVIVISFPFLFEVSHEEKADVSVKCLQELFNSKYSMSIYIIFI